MFHFVCILPKLIVNISYGLILAQLGLSCMGVFCVHNYGQIGSYMQHTQIIDCIIKSGFVES